MNSFNEKYCSNDTKLENIPLRRKTHCLFEKKYSDFFLRYMKMYLFKINNQ
jgi:hypothetical protein